MTSLYQTRIVISLAAVVLFSTQMAELATAQTLQYPPYGALRGRAVARDGIGHVQRYRWGGGLTPTGGAVIMSGFENFAPLLGLLAGGKRDADFQDSDASGTRSTRQVTLPADYVTEQSKADALLARTQSLLSPMPTDNGEEKAQLDATLTKLQAYKKLVDDSATRDEIEKVIAAIKSYQQSLQ